MCKKIGHELLLFKFSREIKNDVKKSQCYGYGYFFGPELDPTRYFSPGAEKTIYF